MRPAPAPSLRRLASRARGDAATSTSRVLRVRAGGRDSGGVGARVRRWFDEHELARRAAVSVAMVAMSRLCYMTSIPDVIPDEATRALLKDDGWANALSADSKLLRVLEADSRFRWLFIEAPANVCQVGYGPMIFSSTLVQYCVLLTPNLKDWAKKMGPLANETMTQYENAVFAGVATLGSIFFARKLVGSGTGAQGVTLALMAGAFILRSAMKLMDDQGVGDGFMTLLCTALGIEYSVSAIVIASSIAAGSLLRAQAAAMAATGVVAASAMAWLVTFARRIPIEYYRWAIKAESQGEAPGSPPRNALPRPYLTVKLLKSASLPVFGSFIVLSLVDYVGVFVGLGSIFSGAPAMRGALVLGLTTTILSCLDLEDVPKDVADFMKKEGAFIRGVRPGFPTETHLRRVRRRLTRQGGVLLGAWMGLAYCADSWFKQEWGHSVGLTSLPLFVSGIVSIATKVAVLRAGPHVKNEIRRSVYNLTPQTAF